MTPLHEAISADGIKTPKFSLVPAELLRDVPNLAPTAPDLDLVGDGFRRFVASDPASRAMGYYSATAQDSFAPFTAFQRTLNQPLEGQNVKHLNVDGDGRAELVLAGENVAYTGPPKLLFCNDSESIHLSDFSGDGLTDLVRIRNGQMGPRVYFNQSGNGLSNAMHIRSFPPANPAASVTVLGLHGDGTHSLVLYSPLPSDAHQPLKFIKLMPEKPHLLEKISQQPRLDHRHGSLRYADRRNFLPLLTTAAIAPTRPTQDDKNYNDPNPPTYP
ncbi:hypothetical protein B0T14DRAFT_497640 [Immersiella caudata]|uniref:VCBS repeat-containing protein n=1 Tax=Immersiella caudata TaxID=314043 RepID=A0AA39WJC8_9PEZI|nr:hypothetical protein B0T14DRAFT_497640 [Immersiella caudata]